MRFGSNPGCAFYECFDSTVLPISSSSSQMEEQEDESSPEGQSAYIWKYFTVSSSNAQTGGSKHIVCMFCRKNFSGCSTTRASAHILGRPVMGQQKAGIHPCLAIQKKDDDRRDQSNTG